MSFLTALRLISVLVCVTGLGTGCDSSTGSLTTSNEVPSTPNVAEPDPQVTETPVEQAPVLTPIVQPSPTPSGGPSPSPTPTASPVPVQTFAFNARGFCNAIESWDSTALSLKLYSSMRNYYYLFTASGVTATMVNVDGSDGTTSTVGEAVLIFTNQLNIGSTGTCTVTLYDGQIESIR